MLTVKSLFPEETETLNELHKYHPIDFQILNFQLY